MTKLTSDTPVWTGPRTVWQPMLFYLGLLVTGACLAILVPFQGNLALAGAGVLVGGFAAARRPLLTVGVILSTIVLLGSDSIFKVSLGVQWVEVDLLLLIATLGVAARILLRREQYHPTRLDLAVMGFALAIGLGMYTGLNRGVDLSLLRSEMRPPGYLVLIYLIVRASIGDGRRSVTLYSVLFAATLLASAKAIVVYLLVPAGFGGDPEKLVWATRVLNSDGAKRILIQGGEIFPVLMILLALPWISGAFSRKRIILGLSSLALLSFTVAISFTRSYWIGLGAGFVSLLFLVSRAHGWRLLRGVAVGVLGSWMLIVGLGWGLESFSAGKFADLIGARSMTLLDSHRDASIQSRLSELRAIGDVITESPLLGRGLGSTYRFYSRDTGAIRNWEYTHNSYAHYMMKTGTIGLLALVIVIGLGMTTAVRMARTLEKGREQLLMAGLTASLLALLVISFFAPWLTHYVGAAYVGLALGVVESRRITLERKSDDPLSNDPDSNDPEPDEPEGWSG